MFRKKKKVKEKKRQEWILREEQILETRIYQQECQEYKYVEY
jgi:hypothetical protein